MVTPSSTFLDLTADRIQLRVNGEAIGWAYGAERWFAASAFIKDRGAVWPLPHQRHWSGEPTMREIARGLTGNGDDE